MAEKQKEKLNEYEAGDDASVFARGLCARGWKVQGLCVEEGSIKRDGEMPTGKVVTDAPQDVFDDMVKAYRTRHAKPAKK